MQFLVKKTVGIVLNSENLKFKKNLLILNFQTSVTQLTTHIIQTFDTGAPHWWLHRDEGNNWCIENTDILQSDCTGWGSGSNGHS
jgi:hypothetical protein